MNKERRTINDRRKFCYTAYSPERRTGQDRRRLAVNNIKKRVA